MKDSERIDQLEKRLNHMTQTLIHIQMELQKLKDTVNEKAVSKMPAVTSEAIKPAEAAVIPETAGIPEAAAVKEPTAIPETKPVPVAPAGGVRKTSGGIEAFIGGKLITIIGIAILVLGLGFFVKYAIDRDMIGPIGRVALGLLSGAVLLGIAFRLKAKYHAFSAVLLSGGMATLYFSVFAAFSFYQLIPREAAFVLMVLLTAFTVFAAVMYDLQVIGIIGLVGAYAVPGLLSDQSGRVLILLSYMTIINIGILVLSFRKNWRLLYQFAMYLSWLMFWGWYSAKYEPDKHLAIALTFSTIFFVIFYLMVVAFKLVKKEKFNYNDVVMLTINSFMFYGIGYDIFDGILGGMFIGLFTLANAVFHFIFSLITYRMRMADRRFFFLQIGLVITFLVIAVPVQLEGSWVTLLWALGAFLLFWIGRTQQVAFYERLSYALILMACISLIHDWGNFYDIRWDTDLSILPVINIMFLTSVIYLGSLTGMLWLGYRPQYFYENIEKQWLSAAMRYILIGLLILLAYIACFLEIDYYFYRLFQASYIKLDYGLYDYDINSFKALWLFNYTALYLSVLSLLITYKWKAKWLFWILFGLNLFFMLIFLPACFGIFDDLRTKYLWGSPNEAYYHVTVWYILIRYIGIAFFLLLIHRFRAMVRNYYPVLMRPLEIFNHFIVLILLSAELSNLIILLKFDSEWAYRVGYSILWGLYSVMLIVIGIWKRKPLWRYASMALVGITLFKVVLYDLADISTGGKIIMFISLGILLLIVAFLYQKFKHVLFDDEETKTL